MSFEKTISAIAIMESCFPEKFGVPRQAGIISAAKGIIRLIAPYNHENYLHGLEYYSHLWLTFGFHQNEWNGKATVRPQRLGGNARMGVFATRSPFRPNGLGLSAVKIDKIHFAEGVIEVSGVDLVDGTPIYCIKPYIPFVDAIDCATSTFALDLPDQFQVLLTSQAERVLESITEKDPEFSKLLFAVLAQNPTPQFHTDQTREYGVSLKHWNITFKRMSKADIPKLNESIKATFARNVEGEISKSLESTLLILSIRMNEKKID